jgi:hypothetical protein
MRRRWSAALIGCAPPISVLDSNDVILVEIGPGLNFNQERRDLTWIGEPVWLTNLDVGGLVLAQELSFGAFGNPEWTSLWPIAPFNLRHYQNVERAIFRRIYQQGLPT